MWKAAWIEIMYSKENSGFYSEGLNRRGLQHVYRKHVLSNCKNSKTCSIMFNWYFLIQFVCEREKTWQNTLIQYCYKFYVLTLMVSKTKHTFKYFCTLNFILQHFCQYFWTNPSLSHVSCHAFEILLSEENVRVFSSFAHEYWIQH